MVISDPKTFRLHLDLQGEVRPRIVKVRYLARKETISISVKWKQLSEHDIFLPTIGTLIEPELLDLGPLGAPLLCRLGGQALHIRKKSELGAATSGAGADSSAIF